MKRKREKEGKEGKGKGRGLEDVGIQALNIRISTLEGHSRMPTEEAIKSYGGIMDD